MTFQPNRQELGECLSMEAVDSLVEKRLSGGYRVRYLPFLWTAGLRVFLKGVVLWRALSNRANVAARLLAQEGAEESMVRVLREVAEGRVDTYWDLP